MSESGDPANRLAGELSPYLLLHQHNPVDWYPWGEAALSRAREEDKPIFLSVGYATCYWCHVMERESFADPAIAALMNEHFVSIKLDREERPDLDEIYMTATQLFTGQGGWPNSVFLTPRLTPFFAGTYFPPFARRGMPAFRDVLNGLSDAWRTKRHEVDEQAGELKKAIKRYLEERGTPGALPPASVATEALASLAGRFDSENGGFGGAPKFPSPSNLYLLDAVVNEAGVQDGSGALEGTAPEAGRMLDATLDHMARGGIYDQVGGGFHRYSVDAEWRVPHFEKMLYDNGHLLALYARVFARSGDAEHARVIRETGRFMAREMCHADGGFYSAIDAETAGFEGGFYVWKRDQLDAALGSEDAAFLAPLFGFEGPPFFEGEHFVLHLPSHLEDQAARRRMAYGELLGLIEPLKAKLLEARGARDRPLTDDKVLADWNGMAISGLATAGRSLGEPEWTEMAASAARFVLDSLVEGGRLHHCWRDGRIKQLGMVADYAFLIRGLLDLAAADGNEAWILAAARLQAEQQERLGDAENGGFFVAADAADLLARSKEIYDGALPSANAVSALNLIDLATVTGERRWRREAEAVLRAFGHFAMRQGDATRMLCVAIHQFHATGISAAGSPATDVSVPERHPLAIASSFEPAGEEGAHDFTLDIALEDGWHLYAPADDSRPAAAAEILGRDAEILELSWPAGRRVRLAEGQPRRWQCSTVVSPSRGAFAQPAPSLGSCSASRSATTRVVWRRPRLRSRWPPAIERRLRSPRAVTVVPPYPRP